MEKTNVYAELVKVLNEMKNPINSVENSYFKSKYVPLSDILDLARPILSKYGFALLQVPTVFYDAVQLKNGGVHEQGVVKVQTSLIHQSGEKIEFPEIVIKAKDASAQSVGSAITYARRYALTSILGICGKDEDDDGNMANGNYPYPSQNAPMQPYQPSGQTITPQQANTLFGYASRLAELKNVDVQRIISNFQLSKFEELPQTHYQAVLNQLSNWLKQEEERQAQLKLNKQNAAQSPAQSSYNPSTQQPSSNPSAQTTQPTSNGCETFFVEKIEKGKTASNMSFARLYVVKKETNERLQILVTQDRITLVDHIQEGKEANLSIGEQNGFKYLIGLGGDNNAA